MVLVTVRPGVSMNTVLEDTAWPLKVSKDLMSTPAPTDTEEWLFWLVLIPGDIRRENKFLTKKHEL